MIASEYIILVFLLFSKPSRGMPGNLATKPAIKPVAVGSRSHAINETPFEPAQFDPRTTLLSAPLIHSLSHLAVISVNLCVANTPFH